MYKWGYFTANPEIDIDRVIDDHSNFIKPRIIAVARFIKMETFGISSICSLKPTKERI